MNNVIFVFGAGSTKFLSIPTSDEQKQLLDELEKDEPAKSLYKIIKGYFEGNCSINDIFNLIDSSILLDIGLESSSNLEVQKAKKNLVDGLFNIIIKNIYKRDELNYNKLVNFYYNIAKYQLDYKIKNHNMNNKEFYITNYSIINFNWDLYSSIPIVEANKKINDVNDYYIPIGSNPKLKIFTDFNCEYVNNNKEQSYSITEGVAKSINKDNYDAKRRMIITKVYYPHGTHNLYKCKKCAKHSMFLGEFNMNSVINNIMKEDFSYECPYCRNKIMKNDFDILVQSNFKIRNSFLEEIRINMMAQLRKEETERLIFIGYSLPNDDLDYITMFKSLNNIKKVYVVLKSINGPQYFTPSREVDENAEKDDKIKQAISNYKTVFKGKDLYFNFAGFPDAIEEILNVYKETLN